MPPTTPTTGSETGAGNALVGAYLNELGLSADAILYLTKAGPRSMTGLTLADARRYDIKVELKQGSADVGALVLPTDQPRPAAAPSVTPAAPPPERTITIGGIPFTAPPSPARPQPAPAILTLPACNSPGVTNELTKIANRRGVAAFNIAAFSLAGTGDMELCGAYASTTVGRLAVTYTVTWADRQAGLFYVQVTSYRRTW